MEANKRNIALVTGGNKGIGLEICKLLASNGVQVILTARDEKRGNDAVEKIIKELGLSNITFHKLDVTDPSSIAALADFVKTQFGKLDILVNNAAIGGFELSKSIDGKLPQEERAEMLNQNQSTTYEQAVECLKTNYYGVKHVISAFLTLLQESNNGRIVNLTSMLGQLKNFHNEGLKNELEDPENLIIERIDELAMSFLKSFKDDSLEADGWETSQGYKSYRVSKVLMNAYSRILAKSYPGLRINCVHPGYVQTDLVHYTGVLSTSEGAAGPIMVALSEGGPTGQFYNRTQISTF